MKYILLIAFIFIAFLNFSQTNQKSLLWKISHKDSEKTSYLYGTMHISGRLAFHLGEEFFEAIEEVDAVALESNPIIWLDEIINSPYADGYLGTYGFKSQTYKGFYQNAFKLTLPDNKNLSKAISNDHYLSNWMLYRSRKGQSDFQEETFLDLFIYQAGMKFGKSVYSLENFKQTTHFSKMGNMPDAKKKEKSAWYEEMTEDKNVGELIRNAYRNKDVLLLDSLHSQINTDNFMHWMLDVRNDIMSVKIDSFIQKENTSLFIGIGAAHLAGEKGVINYLRQKGYTVEPMSTTITDKVKATKEKYDIKKKQIEYNNPFETDLFSLKVPGTMYKTPSSSTYQRQFFSPELTNGSYFSAKIISTYSYFSKTNQADYLLKIDSILFESIPGDIISKTSITNNGYEGIDILNKTTTGNFQRYQIFLTPLNVILFKMGGKDSFAKDMGDGFFKSIQLKQTNRDWTYLTAFNNDFEVKLPAYYNIKGNENITSLYHHFEVEAFDKSDSNYYFMKRASLYDYNFIETDQFELNRIADQFCENLDIDTVDITILEGTEFPTARASTLTPDGQFMELKIIIKGAFYYVLANVSSTKKEQNAFFDSFHFHSLSYNYDFIEKIDSTLLFKTKSNYLYPNKYADIYSKAKSIKQENLKKKKEDLTYKHKYEERTYYSENFERIVVSMYKYHDYAEYANIDSLWSSELNYISKDNKLILKRKQSKIENGLNYLEADFTDTNSCRMIKTKFILKEGALYSLQTTLDTIQTPSLFIQNFFNSFEPLDTVIGKSIFTDKSDTFFEAIYSKDSLKIENALKSVITHVNFKEDDIKNMIKTIDSYNFPSKHIGVKTQLISDLGKINDKSVVPYLVNLYPIVEDTSMYQIAILRGLANQKTKKSFQQFVKLLDHDIPLASKDKNLYSVFYPFYDTLTIAKEIYPELLDYAFVDDYKRSTYALLSNLVTEQKIKGKAYKSRYKQILREAKIELKSQISYEQAEQANQESSYYFSSYKNEGNDLLVNYATLLLPFYTKPAVKEFFLKLAKVEDYMINTDIYSTMVKLNLEVDPEIWTKLSADNINRSYLYSTLNRIDRLDLFPHEFKTQKLIVESLLYDRKFDIEKDSMEYITRKEITYHSDTAYVYFYKSKTQKSDDWSLDYVGLQPLDKTKVNVDYKIRETNIKIEKHKTIDEIIEEELKSIRLDGHKRAKSSDDYSNWF